MFKSLCLAIMEEVSKKFLIFISELKFFLNLDWIAIGFSDYGQATGADLCVFWTDWKGNAMLDVIFIALQS